MPTSRTVTATNRGPIELKATVPSAEVLILVREVEYATVTLETSTEHGPAADAVRDALIDIGSPGYIMVRMSPVAPVQNISAGHGSAVSIGGAGSRNIVIGNFTAGSVTFGDSQPAFGAIVQAGRTVHGAASAAPGTNPVPTTRLTVTLPPDSTIGVETTHGGIDAEGPLRWAGVETVNGNVSLGEVTSCFVKTVNGDVRVAHVTQHATIDTVNGGIQVHGADDVPVKAETINGDITFGRNLAGHARTANGHVRLDKP